MQIGAQELGDKVAGEFSAKDLSTKNDGAHILQRRDEDVAKADDLETISKVRGSC